MQRIVASAALGILLVQLAAGQELYAKIVSLRSWITTGGGSGGDSSGGDYGRNTFYVWLIPANGRRLPRGSRVFTFFA